MKFIVLALISLSAFSFEPTYIESTNFKVKVSKQFQDRNNPKFCKFETFLSDDQNFIKLKMGVVGSPVDYFGWNVQIDLKDFPLKENYKQIVKSPGVTGMELTYDGEFLVFERIKDEKVWNNLYTFKVKINPTLNVPKSLDAIMYGFQRDVFGRLKKHVSTKCSF